MAWQVNAVTEQKWRDGGKTIKPWDWSTHRLFNKRNLTSCTTNVYMYSIQDTQNNNDWRTPVTQLKHRLDVVEDVLFHQKEVLTLEEASKYTGFSCSTLYKLTSAHKIPFYKPAGKVILFEKKELLEWIRKSRVEAKD